MCRLFANRLAKFPENKKQINLKKKSEYRRRNLFEVVKIYRQFVQPFFRDPDISQPRGRYTIVFIIQ